MTKVASPNPSKPGATGSTENPYSLADALARALPTEEILLRGGDYPGTYTIKDYGLTLAPYENEPARFTGPVKPIANAKPAWVHIAAPWVSLLGLRFEREGDIKAAKAFNDFGIVIDADDASIVRCRLLGMTKGIQLRGKCLRPTISECHIGPTYQSNVVLGTSYGVIRAALLQFNTLEGSHAEDGCQFMQNFELSADAQVTDISNLGTILYKNQFRGHGENGLDLKGAGLVVIDGNAFEHIAGSNDGPINGWNHNGGATITRGKGTNSGHAIIRNNSAVQNGGGFYVMPAWYVYHNELIDNNWTPDGSAYDGFGIMARQGGPTAVVVNNLVAKHRAGNVLIPDSDIVRNNPDAFGPGVPITSTRAAGKGRNVPLVDAGYFTDWFGRKELPAEVVYIGGKKGEIAQVDYAANVVTLADDLEWEKGAPVCWMTPVPMAGIATAYVPPPPPVETVRLVFDFDVDPATAEVLRKATANGQVRVSWG